MIETYNWNIGGDGDLGENIGYDGDLWLNIGLDETSAEILVLMKTYNWYITLHYMRCLPTVMTQPVAQPFFAKEDHSSVPIDWPTIIP